MPPTIDNWWDLIPSARGGGGGGSRDPWSYGMDEEGPPPPYSAPDPWSYGMDADYEPPATMGDYGPSEQRGVGTKNAKNAKNKTPKPGGGTTQADFLSNLPWWAKAAVLGGGAGYDYFQRRQAGNVAKKAGEDLGKSAEYAANLIKEAQKEAMAFQKEQWEGAQARMQPYVDQGAWAAGEMGRLMGNPGAPGGAPSGSAAPNRATATPPATIAGMYGG